MPEPLVTPLPGVAPMAAPAEPLAPPAAAAAPMAPPEEGPEPPEKLMAIPAFQALFVGSPPALSYNLEDKSDREERKIAEDNAEYLSQAGFRTYKTLSGDRGVLYNTLYVHPDDLLAADKAGKLKTIAPDFDAVNHAVGKAGAAHPMLHAGEPPTTAAASRTGSLSPQSAVQEAIAARIAPTPGIQPNVPPASSSAQRRFASARVSNLKPTAPTGGSTPGQGAILAAITKPVV